MKHDGGSGGFMGDFKHDHGCGTTLNGHYYNVKIDFLIPRGEWKQHGEHLLQTIYSTYSSNTIYLLSMFLITRFQDNHQTI